MAASFLKEWQLQFALDQLDQVSTKIEQQKAYYSSKQPPKRLLIERADIENRLLAIPRKSKKPFRSQITKVLSEDDPKNPNSRIRLEISDSVTTIKALVHPKLHSMWKSRVYGSLLGSLILVKEASLMIYAVTKGPFKTIGYSVYILIQDMAFVNVSDVPIVGQLNLVTQQSSLFNSLHRLISHISSNANKLKKQKQEIPLDNPITQMIIKGWGDLFSLRDVDCRIPMDQKEILQSIWAPSPPLNVIESNSDIQEISIEQSAIQTANNNFNTSLEGIQNVTNTISGELNHIPQEAVPVNIETEKVAIQSSEFIAQKSTDIIEPMAMDIDNMNGSDEIRNSADSYQAIPLEDDLELVIEEIMPINSINSNEEIVQNTEISDNNCETLEVEVNSQLIEDNTPKINEISSADIAPNQNDIINTMDSCNSQESNIADSHNSNIDEYDLIATQPSLDTDNLADNPLDNIVTQPPLDIDEMEGILSQASSTADEVDAMEAQSTFIEDLDIMATQAAEDFTQNDIAPADVEASTQKGLEVSDQPSNLDGATEMVTAPAPAIAEDSMEEIQPSFENSVVKTPQTSELKDKGLTSADSNKDEKELETVDNADSGQKKFNEEDLEHKENLHVQIHEASAELPAETASQSLNMEVESEICQNSTFTEGSKQLNEVPNLDTHQTIESNAEIELETIGNSEPPADDFVTKDKLQGDGDEVVEIHNNHEEIMEIDLETTEKAELVDESFKSGNSQENESQGIHNPEENITLQAIADSNNMEIELEINENLAPADTPCQDKDGLNAEIHEIDRDAIIEPITDSVGMVDVPSNKEVVEAEIQEAEKDAIIEPITDSVEMADVSCIKEVVEAEIQEAEKDAIIEPLTHSVAMDDAPSNEGGDQDKHVADAEMHEINNDAAIEPATHSVAMDDAPANKDIEQDKNGLDAEIHEIAKDITIEPATHSVGMDDVPSHKEVVEAQIHENNKDAIIEPITHSVEMDEAPSNKGGEQDKHVADAEIHEINNDSVIEPATQMADAPPNNEVFDAAVHEVREDVIMAPESHSSGIEDGSIYHVPNSKLDNEVLAISSTHVESQSAEKVDMVIEDSEGENDAEDPNILIASGVISQNTAIVIESIIENNAAADTKHQTENELVGLDASHLVAEEKSSNVKEWNGYSHDGPSTQLQSQSEASEDSDAESIAIPSQENRHQEQQTTAAESIASSNLDSDDEVESFFRSHIKSKDAAVEEENLDKQIQEACSDADDASDLQYDSTPRRTIVLPRSASSTPKTPQEVIFLPEIDVSDELIEEDEFSSPMFRDVYRRGVDGTYEKEYSKMVYDDDEPIYTQNVSQSLDSPSESNYSEAFNDGLKEVYNADNSPISTQTLVLKTPNDVSVDNQTPVNVLDCISPQVHAKDELFLSLENGSISNEEKDTENEELESEAKEIGDLEILAEDEPIYDEKQFLMNQLMFEKSEAEAYQNIAAESLDQEFEELNSLPKSNQQDGFNAGELTISQTRQNVTPVGKKIANLDSSPLFNYITQEAKKPESPKRKISGVLALMSGKLTPTKKARRKSSNLLDIIGLEGVKKRPLVELIDQSYRGTSGSVWKRKKL